MSDEMICRCEEVSLDTIVKTICDGALTERQVKLATRAGMGSCQGRICRQLIEHLVGQLAPPLVAPARPPVRRLPVRPQLLGDMAAEGESR